MHIRSLGVYKVEFYMDGISKIWQEMYFHPKYQINYLRMNWPPGHLTVNIHPPGFYPVLSSH